MSRWSCLVSIALALVPALLMLRFAVVQGARVVAATEDAVLPAVARTFEEEYGVRLRYSSARVDLRRGEAKATGVFLADAEGEPLAFVPSLRLLFSGVETRRTFVRLEAVGASLYAVRMQDGTFEWQRIFYRPGREPVEIPVDISLRDTTLHYVDLGPRRPSELLFRNLDAAMQVSGLEGRLSCVSDCDATGALRLNATWARGGAELRAAGSRVSGSAVIDALRTQFGVDGTERLRLSNARGQVRLAATWGADRADWIVQGEAVAEGASYDRYRASNLQASFLFAPDDWRVGGTFRSRGSEAEVVATGQQAKRFDAWLAWSGRSAAEVWRLLGNTETCPFAGEFSARLGLYKDGNALWAVGRGRVARLHATGRAASDVEGEFVYEPGRSLALTDLRATWRGSEVGAEARMDLRTGKLAAVVNAKGVPIESFQEAEARGLSGRVDIAALLTGLPDELRVSATLDVPALHWKQPGGEKSLGSELGRAEARVIWSEERLAVPLARIAGRFGLLQSSITYQADSDWLELSYDAVGVPLDAFAAEWRVGGSAYVSGSVSGSLDAPLFSGRAEIFDLEFGGFDAAVCTGSFAFSNGSLALDDVQLRRGAAVVDAEGELDFRSGDPGPLVALRLRGDRVEASRVLEALRVDAPLKGLARIEALVTGYPNDLRMVGVGELPDGQLDKLGLSEARAVLAYDQGRLLIEDGYARVGGGELRGRASLADGEIAADLTLTGADISAIDNYLDPRLSATGRVSMTATLSGSEVEPVATVTGTLEQTKIAGLRFRGGRFDAELRNKKWSGFASLSGDDRLAEVRLSSYDFENRAVEGHLHAEVDLTDLRSVLRRFVPEQTDPVLWQRFGKLHGRVAADVSAEGELGRLAFPFDIRVRDLRVGGREAGSLDIRGVRAGDLYNLDAIKWDSTVGSLFASGTYETEGEVLGTVDIANLDLGLLHEVEPQVSDLRGRTDVTAQLYGEARRPEIALTVAVSDFGMGQFNVDSAMFSLVEVRDGSIRTEGAVLQKEGYVARLSGEVPFRYEPFGIVRDRALHLEATIPEQEIAGLRVFLPTLDAERTRGTIHGETAGPTGERPIRLSVSGTANSPRLEGAAILRGEQIAVQGVDETLKDVGGLLRLSGSTVKLENLNGSSGSGGRFEGSAVVELGDGEGSVRGELRLDGLHVRSSIPDVPYPLRMTSNGALFLSGTLEKPVVTGEIEVSDATLPVPSGWEGRMGAAVLPFDADADVAVVFAPSTTLRTARMEARVQGAARLERSLRLPKASGSLTALDGRIRLPASRLRIEPGSRFTLAYDAQKDGPPMVAANVDMKARTRLVAADPMGIPTEYGVELQISGSLLDDDGLKMTATSSPPDLTEQRILALLGHQGFLDTFAGGDVDRLLRSELLDIFGATVLPEFFDVIGPSIAERVGLEAFALTYSRFEPLTLNVSKSLFDGLSASYRRSLEGVEQRYQVKLMWRLPIREQFRGTFGLGWSYDEQKVHRLSLEWGTRF